MNFWGTGRGIMIRNVLACAMLAGLTACASNPRIATDYGPVAPPARIVLMEPEVEMGLLTTGGLVEPRADWSQSAEDNLTAAMVDQIEAREHVVVEFDSGIDAAERQRQLVVLHKAVAGSAFIHGPDGVLLPLPTKQEEWDWTLGEGTEVLKDAYDADLGLFLFANGSYASAGRIATGLFAAALGVSVPQGQRLAVASLVDLETGDIVWMSYQLGHDPREEEGAANLVDRLFSDAPF
ncbi:hypothetical protein [Marinicauda salina]|uniref:hypothetical protein n=1 Tax=Marinicauda salina TaxID=2135793 RepID=UPI001304E941|nr:hypothetical protein [Marinicauda salina]